MRRVGSAVRCLLENAPRLRPRIPKPTHEGSLRGSCLRRMRPIDVPHTVGSGSEDGWEGREDLFLLPPLAPELPTRRWLRRLSHAHHALCRRKCQGWHRKGARYLWAQFVFDDGERRAGTHRCKGRKCVRMHPHALHHVLWWHAVRHAQHLHPRERQALHGHSLSALPHRGYYNNGSSNPATKWILLRELIFSYSGGHYEASYKI